MDIAVIGTGISGLSCAYLLKQSHNVTLFEKNSRIGGHTATIDIKHKGKSYNIDTGFIVYNDWTYPNFIKLLDKLHVKSQATNMSFSVSCERTGLEYGGSNLNGLFAQRKNLLNIPYLQMLRDIVKFNRDAISDLENKNLDRKITLGEYLKIKGYSPKLASHYLIPMGSAIWSSTLQETLAFPLLFFVRFFKNHGLLNIKNRPQWRVLKGGSKRYLKPITEGLENRIVLNANIKQVTRTLNEVVIDFEDGSSRNFDEVVFACHSDEALQLLGDANTAEQDILKAIPYRNNHVVLHTDVSLLPKAKRAWSAWNYHLGGELNAPATLSYNMNILQGLTAEDTFVVTLNAGNKIASDKILGEYEYAHPVFSLEGIKAQSLWHEINGVNRTWFCGAYWKNGFHEDGCTSGIRVAQALGAHW